MMMMKYVPGGPERYEHQKRGLMKMIETKGQTAILFEPGMGKALALDTRVETPSGTRLMADIRPGNYVFGIDGRPTRVLSVYEPPVGVAYKVTFNDGAHVICDADHVWAVHSSYTWENDRPHRLKTTAELVDAKVSREDGSPKWYIPHISPLRYDDKKVIFPPYAMGAMLANGYPRNGQFTSHREQIAWRISKEAHLRTIEVPFGMPRSSSRRWRFEGIRPFMDMYGLMDMNARERYIPTDYLQGSVTQRMELLRGLMDCDGYITQRRRPVYHTSSTRLADDMVTLVRSLGGLATKRTHQRKSHEVYSVLMWLPFNPFWVDDKASKYDVADRRRSISSIEEVPYPSHGMRCLKVQAKDGLFVIESGIVTHNTAIVLDYAGMLAAKSQSEARALVVCPLVAVDTWVTQAAKFLSPQVGYWAEALGGSLLDRATALAARGGNPYPAPLTRSRPTPPKGWFTLTDSLKGFTAHCMKCSEKKSAQRSSTVDKWWAAHLKHHGYVPRAKATDNQDPRAQMCHKAIEWGYRHAEGAGGSLVLPEHGPDVVKGPRLVLEVINIDAMSSRHQFGRGTMADVMVDAIKRFNPDVVVVDEGHLLKSPRSNSSRLMARISKTVNRRVLLTGTVTPAGPMDVFAQWRFIDPYAFGSVSADGTRQEATLAGFQDRYVKFGGWANKEIVGYRNLDHMQQVMSKNAIVGRKADALDLPPTTEVVLNVTLSPNEEEAYRQMKGQLAVQLADGSTASVASRLTQMLRLRQITSGYLPEDGGDTRIIGTSKSDKICSLVNDTLAGEKRIVIFCVFSQEIAMLSQMLAKDTKTSVMVIEGSTPVQTRLAMRQRFGSDDPQRMIIVAQIKTLSLAVNELVTASHAIFASMSQQRDVLIQARDRLDRIGQTRPVTFWMAVAGGTVDEVILKTHRERTSLEKALLEHITQAS